jgi:hypothetical protein
MRSKYLLGLLLSGVVLAAASSGCGGEAKSTTGGAGGGSSSSGSGSSSSSGAQASSGAGGAEPDKNVDCASAEEFPGTTDGIDATLEPVDSDRDYYKITLKKGDPVYFKASAKPDSNTSDPAYADTVITLYSEDGKTQLARNDDITLGSNNNSELLFVAPADGVYCLEVAECIAVFGQQGCSPAGDITDNNYNTNGFVLDPASPASSPETEPNDTPDKKSALKAAKVNQVSAYITLGWGGFSSATDVDIYGLKPSTVAVDSGGRQICIFDFYQGGTDHSGSTADAKVRGYVTTAADPATKIADVDVTVADKLFQDMPSLAFPCDPAQDYLFFMTRDQGATAGSNDFYFFNITQAESNKLEAEPNDDMAKPEALAASANNPNGYPFTGDISKAGTDVDIFSVPVKVGLKAVSVYCAAQRNGSGLRGLKATVYGTGDTALAKGTATEAADQALLIDAIDIPDGTAELKVKLEAASQDPAVTGTSYYCNVVLSVP